MWINIRKAFQRETWQGRPFAFVLQTSWSHSLQSLSCLQPPSAELEMWRKLIKKTSLEPADLAQVHRHGLSLHNDQVHKLSQKECSPCTALPIFSVQLCKTTWNSHWQKPESEILNPGLLSKEGSWSWHLRAASETRHLTCLISMLRYILPLTNQARRPGGMISQLQLVRQSQQVGLGWLPGSPGCPSRITWNCFCHLWEGWWRRIRPGEGSRVYFNSSCFRCKRHSLSRNKD